MIGLRPDEAEKIGLLASILGWEVERRHAVRRTRSRNGRVLHALDARDSAPPSPSPTGGELPWVNGRLAKEIWPEVVWPEDAWPEDAWPDDVGTQGSCGPPNCGARASGPMTPGTAGTTVDSRPHAAATAAHPRLLLREAGKVILVETDDSALGDQLARMGLDRLVLPVPLSALEELLVFAG